MVVYIPRYKNQSLCQYSAGKNVKSTSKTSVTKFQGTNKPLIKHEFDIDVSI